MLTLTITAKGQITFKQDVLKHLGVCAGEKVTVDKLADGRITIKAIKPLQKTKQAFGILVTNNTRKTSLTIDEVRELTAQAWAGKKR